MPITKLAHYSIRTTRLDASRRFYCEVLGFSEGTRPPFDFPGAWLYRGGDEAEYGTVHLIGVDPNDSRGLGDYLGHKAEEELRGSGAVDHIAFLATDLVGMHRRLQDAGVQYHERTVPALDLHQVFIQDPSGVTIELNFAAAEAKALPVQVRPASTA